MPTPCTIQELVELEKALHTVKTHQFQHISQYHILRASYSHPYAKHGLDQANDTPGAAAEGQAFFGEEHLGVPHDRLRRADR